MRLIHLAHGLIGKAGHHYMEARALKEEGAKLGLDSLVLAHRDVSLTIRDELQALALFQDGPYKEVITSRLFRSLSNFSSFGQNMRDSLLNLGADGITEDDILIVPLVKAQEMFGIALWLAATPAAKHPFVALNFMIDDISRQIRGTKKRRIDIRMALFYRWAFHRLKKVIAPERLLLTSGGELFAQTMSRVLGHRVHEFPLPVQHDISVIQAESCPQSSEPLIVYLGNARRKKGAELVGAVAKKVLQRHPHSRFLLHANPIVWEKKWIDQIGKENMDRVEIFKGEMTQGEYRAAMHRADIVLLPYPPWYYALQTSGVFSEAVALGKVCVVPQESWMGEMAQRIGGGAAMFKVYSVEAMAAATLDAVIRHGQLESEMQNIRWKWASQMGMQAFLKRIIDVASGGEVGCEKTTDRRVGKTLQ